MSKEKQEDRSCSSKMRGFQLLGIVAPKVSSEWMHPMGELAGTIGRMLLMSRKRFVRKKASNRPYLFCGELIVGKLP